METAIRKEEVTARAGLPLVIEVSRALGLEDVMEREVVVARRQRRFSDVDKMEAFFLLIASGGDRVEDIRILSEDEGLLSLLERKLPSPDVLLDFLEAFDDPSVWEGRPQGELSFVPPETLGPVLSEDRWEKMETRENEEVHLAELEFTPGDWEKGAKPLRYVGLRITPRQGVLFGERPVRYLAYVSNREDLRSKELVKWHWQKAGTIEHVHRVMKDELGAGVLPSGKFGANAAWFRLNVLTHNLLAVLKRRALPERYRSARPKRLRFEIFTIPARIREHEGRLTASLSAEEGRVKEIVEARERLAEMNEMLMEIMKLPSAQNRPAALGELRP